MKKKNKGRNTQVRKATSEELNVARLRMSEQGTFALAKVQVETERMKAEEIKWPQLIGTVEAMKQDATVATGLDMLYTFVEKAFKDFKVMNSAAS